MRIIIKSLSVLNFKGIRDLSIDFNAELTKVLGANGTGKSTLFDAFTWLLFGKDSSDRKDFNIKTIDPMTLVAIERIPHEVAATLQVDDREIKLRKCYTEKWTKKKGSAIEEFDGHKVEYYVNDVPCGAREYQKEIDSITPEHIFKLITNPLYFPSQKKDIQRQTLFSMAGAPCDKDIAANREDFSALMLALTGKTLEGYKKEIAVKKKRIKDEILVIPGRIDERKRSIPEEENWAELLVELENKKQMVADIDKQILDRSKAMQEANKAKQAIISTIHELKNERLELQFSIKERVQCSYRAKESKQKELIMELNELENQARRTKSIVMDSESDLNRLNQERDTLLEEWREINKSVLVINDDFVCPTCNRTLEEHDIQAKKANMFENFNSRKATQLKTNQSKGFDLKSKKEALENEIKRQKESLNILVDKCQLLKESPELTEQLVAPDATPTIEADKDYIALCNKITDLENQAENEASIPDSEELSQGKSILNIAIEELNQRLAKKSIIEENKKRINALEEEQRTLSQELAELEGIEFTIAEFSKAKIEAVENKINGLFDVVKFKMYETQINGGEVETCEAMVDGVPFSDLNTAMKINAGLDIINAICRYNEVNAPIFVDNAESVNKFLYTESQMIQLIVTTDNSLIID